MLLLVLVLLLLIRLIIDLIGPTRPDGSENRPYLEGRRGFV
jgi:hypothetical protein